MKQFKLRNDLVYTVYSTFFTIQYFIKTVPCFLERYPHGIFAAGGANVPTQEKKKKNQSLRDYQNQTLGKYGPKTKILSDLLETFYTSQCVEYEFETDI